MKVSMTDLSRNAGHMYKFIKERLQPTISITHENDIDLKKENIEK